MSRRAIFLDRDGTIIEDVGYIKNPEDVQFFSGTFPALLKLQDFFQLFIITNQSGISKGITSYNEVDNVNAYILNALNSEGIYVTELFCCPHSNEDNCECKKPKPYFVRYAAEKYNLNLSESIIIGDHPSDVECGLNAGMIPVYVLTGHGYKHKNELNYNCIICSDIADATKYVLQSM